MKEAVADCVLSAVFAALALLGALALKLFGV